MKDFQQKSSGEILKKDRRILKIDYQTDNNKSQLPKEQSKLTEKYDSMWKPSQQAITYN